MEVYDDRPISVYDNLKTPTNIHTSTPIAKSATTFAPAASSSSPSSSSPSSSSLLPTTTAVAPAANGATRSPIYTDISFMFNDNNKQQQQRAEPSQLLPSSNRSLNPNRLPTASQVHSNSTQAPYEYKAATNTTPPQYHTSPAPAQRLPTQLPAAQNISTATTTATDAAAAAAAAANAATAVATTLTTAKQPTAAMNASPAQRPLSQHSQSELNEASQSIAAVKAALNDAKSKFFGLNGYAQDTPSLDTNESQTPLQPHSHHHPVLLPDSQLHYPRVQIVTVAPAPPPKPQPKYQNIPENSAIFRNRPPPELPPKPESVALAPAGGSSPKMSTTTTPQTPMSTASPSTSTTPISAAQSPQSPTAAQAKTLPYTAYKQLPLNDIDTSQPSQAVYMSTTVPQNIKGSKIAGRHTPTRNSLRHSRMLVVNNKNYQGTQHPNPMNFKYPNLARWLLILEIIVGILISFLSIWIFFLAPNTAVQDNPYWSGLALLLTGILGLVLVRYQRIKRHKVRENCFLFLRADSYLLALLTVLLCCVALICAAIHYARLTASDTECVSTNILLEHGSCTCTFNAVDVPPANDTADLANGLLDEEIVPENFEDLSYKVEYRDLSCNEVNGAWTCILGISIALNSLGLLVSLIYIVLLSCFRHSSKRFYTSVHTSTF